jgi:ATP adenylyltransferase/5',5'''-P-1,P-4-tetraphosphate phosphorylase II
MSQLYFASSIGRKKPVTVSNQSTACPFCQTKELENIIEMDDSIILLKNKYPTLQETLQLVLIETDECFGDLSRYPKAHLHKLLKFGIRHWLDLGKDPQYQSVIFYKNHGPLSGGTIRHPHMQIVALKNVDYRKNLEHQNFHGVKIYKDNAVEFNVSTSPIMGFREFNVKLKRMDNVGTMADCIQAAVRFLVDNPESKCDSYNLFFYNMEEYIVCKIIARYVVSPLFVGYKIPQVANDIEMTAKKVEEDFLLF